MEANDFYTGQEVWCIEPTYAPGYYEGDKYQNGVTVECGVVMSVGPELVCVWPDEGVAPLFVKRENIFTGSVEAWKAADETNKKRFRR